MNIFLNREVAMANNYCIKHSLPNYINTNENKNTIQVKLSLRKHNYLSPNPVLSDLNNFLITDDQNQKYILLNKSLNNNGFNQLGISQKTENDLIRKMMKIKSSSQFSNKDDCSNVFSLLNIDSDNKKVPLNTNDSRKCISKKHISKNFFTKEEDEKIKKLVKHFGTACWPIVASFLDGRTPKQCRDRYFHYLIPGIFQGEWSKKEDELLIEKYNELGSKWSQIQSFFPNRNAISIKNRWNFIFHQNFETLKEKKDNLKTDDEKIK